MSADTYGHDLALVHDRGYGHHAVNCAPGILDLLAPVLERDGVVLELGCGSGLLTRELLLEWGAARMGAPSLGLAGPDWAIITEFSIPAPDRFVRDITTFVPNDDGSWRRDTEHHENALVDTSRIPALLRDHGVDATVRSAFGTEDLPQGLRAVIAHRPPTD